MIEIINGASKCALCKKEVVDIDTYLLFLDEAGYIRFAHIECFNNRYKEVAE